MLRPDRRSPMRPWAKKKSATRTVLALRKKIEGAGVFHLARGVFSSARIFRRDGPIICLDRGAPAAP
jgi:hypothetical protein